MEIKELQAIVLIFVFVGMILGVGVLVLDRFSRATRTTTTVQDDAVNISGGSATLSQTYCLDFVSATFANGTAISTSSFAWANADTCAMTATAPDAAVLYNITYTYGAATDAQATLDATNDSITPIGETWLPLVVTVVILSIILTLVITSFARTR